MPYVYNEETATLEEVEWPRLGNYKSAESTLKRAGPYEITGIY